MADPAEETVGKLIRRKREHYRPRKMIEEELARQVGVSRSLVSRWERDTRKPTATQAVKVADVLEFSPYERQRLYQMLGFAEIAGDYHRGETDRRWYEEGIDTLRRIARDPQLRTQWRAHPPEILLRWARGRLCVGRFEVDRALEILKPVAAWADATREDDPSEIRDIILLDLADAYAIAGQLPAADTRSVVAAEHSLQLLDREPSERHHMAVGRALVMRQEIAYERGDEAACWQFHNEALPYLDQAQDHYGRAKSLFFIALFRFWQGDLQDAATHARQAQLAAADIKNKRDQWWALRDGFFLAKPWWRTITTSLWLDVMACRGQGSKASFDNGLALHRRLQDRLMPDFPPFSPRYVWLSNAAAEDRDQFGTDHAPWVSNELDWVSKDLDRSGRDLAQWVVVTRQYGCLHLHTDLLLGYGDFLRVARDDQKAANRTYEEALTIARQPEHGYELLAVAAARRLAGEYVFPGLASFSPSD